MAVNDVVADPWADDLLTVDCKIDERYIDTGSVNLS